MLGETVQINVTKSADSASRIDGNEYKLINYGVWEDTKTNSAPLKEAYILGFSQPIGSFEGRVIGLLKRHGQNENILIVAPHNRRFVDVQIREALASIEPQGSYFLECLFEQSYGAVIFKEKKGVIRFLLIKNRHSACWGFPKGHIEDGETPKQTACREVSEETGLDVELLPDFEAVSTYVLTNGVEKQVNLFLAKTSQATPTIQKSEISDYAWLKYEKAKSRLRFENDRRILKKAYDFLTNNNLTGGNV